MARTDLVGQRNRGFVVYEPFEVIRSSCWLLRLLVPLRDQEPVPRRERQTRPYDALATHVDCGIYGMLNADRRACVLDSGPGADAKIEK